MKTLKLIFHIITLIGIVFFLFVALCILTINIPDLIIIPLLYTSIHVGWNILKAIEGVFRDCR